MGTDDLQAIINKIANKQYTEEDITLLQQLVTDNPAIASQIGKNIVNIGDGKEIHIGDRIYQQWDKETIRALIKEILEESNIHHNTQSVHADGKDNMFSQINYHDFQVLVSKNNNIRASSEYGEEWSELHLEMEEIGLTLELIESGKTSSNLLKKLGNKLYQALFPTKIHGHFKATMAAATANQYNVRLRLVFESPELAALPWEFLYDEGTNTFLANNTQTALSRYIDVPLQKRDLKATSLPLKVLLVISSPSNLPQLDVTGEEKLIREALANHIESRKIELDVLEDATIRNISQKLREKDYNVFHFIGHGVFDNNKGYIALVDNDSKSKLLDDESFANFFLGNSNIGLVVLNSCQGAVVSSNQAFAGTAPNLVRRGIPAVVAMQYSILDSTAKLFADEFYRTLALGWPVDAAIQTTRNAISMEIGLDKRDFATPVLYMRAKDGIILTSDNNGNTLTKLLAKNSNFRNLSPDSLKDLDFSKVPPESIQQAYQNALPPDARLWGLAENNIKTILKKIEEFRRLSLFFNLLSQDENISSEIRNQCREIANKLATKKHPEEITNNPPAGYLKSYLIATLKPENQTEFLLNAWLIRDHPDNSVQDLSKFQSLLDENEQQTGILCNLNQIPTEINKFLKKAVTFLRGRRFYLAIEFFLPSNLMCMEIDRWKIKINDSDEIILGTKYSIRLRSLERLNLNYLDFNWTQWCEYWDKVKKTLQDKPTEDLFEHLQEIESFNSELFQYNKKIGLKITCAHPQSISKDLFRSIRLATTPIVIWTRINIPSLDKEEQAKKINEIITLKPLCDLCESVKETRIQAHTQTEEHLGHHLALLWENPYRLTPDVMLELTTPGQ
jgi:CHAT domain-containing protein